ncbi:MAG: ABC transporter ATP-binding protein [Gammaproteobacteria bacterium]
MASILLENLTVEFPIYHVNARSIKKQFLRLTTGGKLSKTDNNVVIVKALDNISLHIEHGDRVGLLGHNGAGKSTLLRVFARIYEPTRGYLHIDGKVSPLLDLTLGMDGESTGYENILTRGLLLGLKRQQIMRKMHEIAEFSELGDYLSMPIRTYSSGMNLRLAFAVATDISPEILILDEIVGAGDASFIAKAARKMEDLMKQSSIVILASHSQDILRKTCNKVLVMEAGKVKFFGSTEQGIAAYSRQF